MYFFQNHWYCNVVRLFGSECKCLQKTVNQMQPFKYIFLGKYHQTFRFLLFTHLRFVQYWKSIDAVIPQDHRSNLSMYQINVRRVHIDIQCPFVQLKIEYIE